MSRPVRGIAFLLKDEDDYCDLELGPSSGRFFKMEAIKVQRMHFDGLLNIIRHIEVSFKELLH